MRLFVTGTGTEVGKSIVSRAAALALHRRGANVAAIKPVETGCAPDPADALDLAAACVRPALAHAPGLYRARRPVAPYAATLAGEPPPPTLSALADAVRAAWADATHAIVEGAGGPLVPYDTEHDLIDLAAALELPVLLVARDALGVLSHTFTAAETLRSRGLTLRAVLLNRDATPQGRAGAIAGDPSTAHNLAILRARFTPTPVLAFEPPSLAPGALADTADRSGLTALFDDASAGTKPRS
jgi:dethiobiotin synthase